MSTTVFRYKGYRFCFFSREETRMHVHVISSTGEAKFWIEPTVELSNCAGLSKRQLNELERIVNEHKKEIEEFWKKHFSC